MGTKQGGNSAAVTNKKRHGAQFYSRIGSMGGSKKTDRTSLKGFGSNRLRASLAGKKGGAVSRRVALVG